MDGQIDGTNTFNVTMRDENGNPLPESPFAVLRREHERLLNEIRAHRFDTLHLVEKLGSRGYKPRLADQMLYEAAGLERVNDA